MHTHLAIAKAKSTKAQSFFFFFSTHSSAVYTHNTWWGTGYQIGPPSQPIIFTPMLRLAISHCNQRSTAEHAAPWVVPMTTRRGSLSLNAPPPPPTTVDGSYSVATSLCISVLLFDVLSMEKFEGSDHTNMIHRPFSFKNKDYWSTIKALDENR